MTNLSSLFKSRLLALAASVILLGFTVFEALTADWIDVMLAVASTILLFASVIYAAKADKELARVQGICKALSLGDFSVRITGIKESGTLGEMCWAINELVDNVDAYIRESAASMEYVSRNSYFRRIKEEGLHGDLKRASNIINKAMDSVEKKMNGFVTIATDVDQSLSSVVTSINSTVGTLGQAASTMVATVEVTREGANAAVLKSDETSQNVSTIAAAAEEMSAAVDEISQQISRTSQLSEKAVATTEQSKEIMTQLVETSRKIGQVVQLIEDIAEKTNLLALNATIEAARAGEAGRGFAVVANEVKNLAGQTAKATEEVNEQIASIQQATHKAVESFTTIGDMITKIDESATIVAAAVEEQSAASKEIASSAGKASEGVMNMVEHVREIDKSVAQVDTEMNLVSNASDELSVHSKENIKELLGKMSIFMNELKKIA